MPTGYQLERAVDHIDDVPRASVRVENLQLGATASEVDVAAVDRQVADDAVIDEQLQLIDVLRR